MARFAKLNLLKFLPAVALAAAFMLPASSADARYWHHGGWGGGFGPGFALGLGGYPYGYGGYYGYGVPYYGGYYGGGPYYGGYYPRGCRTVRTRWRGHWRRVVRCY